MTVPTCLLTYTTLADCAQAMVAHNGSRRALTPHGQVLYDYCMDHGIDKLSPCAIYQSNRLSGPDALYVEYGVRFPVLVHQWLVYMTLLGDRLVFSTRAQMLPQRWFRLISQWLLNPSPTHQMQCEFHNGNGPPTHLLKFVYDPHMFRVACRRKDLLAIRLCHALYAAGHLPPMTPEVVDRGTASYEILHGSPESDSRCVVHPSR